MLGGTSLEGVFGWGERDESDPDEEPTDSSEGVRRSRSRADGDDAADTVDALRKLRKGAKCSNNSDSSMRRS